VEISAEPSGHADVGSGSTWGEMPHMMHDALIVQRYPGLAMGDIGLAPCPAGLPFDADRRLPLVQQVAAVQAQHAIGLTPSVVHCLPRAVPERLVLPGPSLRHSSLVRTAWAWGPAKARPRGSLAVRCSSSSKPCRDCWAHARCSRRCNQGLERASPPAGPQPEGRWPAGTTPSPAPFREDVRQHDTI